MAYKAVKQKATVADLIGGGYSDAQELRDEAQEYLDNSESFSSTQKYQDMESAKDELEQHCDSEPELPENVQGWAKATVIEWTEMVNKDKRRGPSRDVRAANAGAMLEAAVEAIRKAAKELFEVEADELEQAADELEQAADTFRSVSFPGMYG